MLNKKVCFIILLLVEFTAVFSIPSVMPSLTNSVVINSSGQITTPNATAESGSAEDIQAAVDWVAAHGGIGDVHIPEGTFNFVEVGEPWVTVEIPAGVNIFGALTERDSDDQVIEWKTVLVMPYDVPGSEANGIPNWFRIIGDSDPDEPSRFSDIKLVGYRSIDPESASMHTAISIESVLDFRIDHCYFEHTTAGISCYSGYLKPEKIRGVIDHCKFINKYGIPDPYEIRTIDYGVHIFIYMAYDSNPPWEPIDEVLGHYTDYTVFIEDCYFELWRHCVASNNGGHYVFRYNTIQYDFGFGSLDLHEKRVDVAARAAEIYENQLLDPLADWTKIGILWRGGGGVAFNNTVTGYTIFARLIEHPEQEEIYRPHDIWVWNNDLPANCVDIEVDGNSQEGVHYWRHAPHTFTYTPYPYPHPLSLEQ